MYFSSKVFNFGENLHRHSLLSNPIDLSIKYLKWKVFNFNLGRIDLGPERPETYILTDFGIGSLVIIIYSGYYFLPIDYVIFILTQRLVPVGQHVASCDGFLYYYRFSDIAINSVNPSFMTIGIFKEWLVKYFFVHKIVLKAILVF